jgi:hypothetical protein
MKLEHEDGSAYDGSELWLVLSESEARDLAEGLIIYFTEHPRDGGWHDHLGDRLTLGITAADQPLDIRLELDGTSRR